MEKRQYRYKDARLIEIAGVMEEHLINHTAALSRFDPTLSPDWYQPIYQAAKKTTLDDFVKGGVSSSTALREAQVLKCRGYYRQLCYFIELAFAERRSILEQFDLDNYKEVRSSNVKFLRFMQHILRQLALHKASLEAQGMPPNLLQEVEREVAQLDSYISQKVEQQSTRRGQTAERVSALNKLYKALQRIDRVAGFVFADEPKHLKSLRLPRQPRSKKAPMMEVAPDKEQQEQ